MSWEQDVAYFVEFLRPRHINCRVMDPYLRRLPRRTKKAWGKYQDGHRLTQGEHKRVSRVPTVLRKVEIVERIVHA